MVLSCDLSDDFLNMSFFILVYLNIFFSASLFFCSFILSLRSKTAETEYSSINTYHIEKAVLSIEAATLNPSGVSRVSSSQVPPSLLRDCVETKMGMLKIWPVFILEIKLYEIIKQIDDLTIRILSGSIILSFFDYLLILFFLNSGLHILALSIFFVVKTTLANSCTDGRKISCMSQMLFAYKRMNKAMSMISQC